jgi:isoamylase
MDPKANDAPLVATAIRPLNKTHSLQGVPSPLGASLLEDGTNFSLFSSCATGITISFFDHVDTLVSQRSIRLDPAINRTGHYWHIFIPGVKAGQIYGYRAEGPNDPKNGQRFDESKILIDPYGKAVAVGKN